MANWSKWGPERGDGSLSDGLKGEVAIMVFFKSQQSTETSATAKTESAPVSEPAVANTKGGGLILVSPDTIIKGEIRNCGSLEVHGYFEGAVQTDKLLVHPGGRVFGTVKAASAEIHGTLQGEVFIRNLIHIGRDGEVTGNVQYGRIKIETGGVISAEVRNIPPEIAGDLQVSVRRGKAVLITTLDLTAVDPDDGAEQLTYTVSNETNGHVAMASAPGTKISNFTQADLEANRIVFQHNGQGGNSASFDVVVRDAAGASSGKPQRVNVAVS